MSLPTKSVYQHNFPYQSGNKPFGIAPGKTDNTKREPLKCWGCGEEHLLRECPHRKQNNRRVYKFQEATKFNDVARRIPQSIKHWLIDKMTAKLRWWRWKV
jgi:hypothetical protein